MPSEADLETLGQQARAALDRAESLLVLEKIEKHYLGRKGGLTQILRSLKDVPVKERRGFGAAANKLRKILQVRIREKRESLKQADGAADFDLTLPGRVYPAGAIHPLTKIRREIEGFFRDRGFTVLEGPELETDYYNFEALNIPPDHPARDIWDTFYINLKTKNQNAKSDVKHGERLLLRTHTSAMQVRVMEKQKPPLAIIVPGRTFRHEATDARHEHTFDQIEGFYVNAEASAGQLKYLLHSLFRAMFGKGAKIRLRPGYFPFTEPSFELIMSCPFCHERGCAACGAGWLEMLGAGMIHPKVFVAAGYPAGRWRGFAFGLGLARVAMLKYNISDIRMLYQNDLRVLQQF